MSILFGQGPNNQGFDEPTIIATIDPSNGNMFPIGQKWINTVSNEIFFLTSYANGLPVWTGSVSGGAGIFGDLTVTPGPTAITGEFRVLGDVDEAAVIRLQANGGVTETIVIETVQGTGADSIQINSQAGGIEIVTDAAAKDILVSSALGSIGIVAGEDAQDALIIQADGGTSTGLLIENTSGTGAGSAITSAVGILATDGSVYIESQDNFAGAVVLDASDVAGGILLNSGTGGTALTSTGNIASSTTLGDINLTADAGDINIEATLGALNFTAGGGISYSVTGAIDLDATLTSHFKVTGAAEDLQLQSVGGSVDVLASEAVADAIVISATGASAGIQIAPAATVASVAIANVIPTVARTVTVSGGAVGSAVADTLNLGTGATNFAGASKVVNIATGNNTLGTDTLNLSTGSSATGTKAVNIGNVDSLTTITAIGAANINTTGTAATTIGSTATGGLVDITSATEVRIEPVTTLTLAPTSAVTTIAIGNITPTVDRTTTINGGAVIAAHIDLVSIAGGGVNTNAGAEKEVLIATGATAVGTTRVDIATGNVSAAGTTNLNMVTGNAPVGTTQVVQFGTGTGGGTKQINIGGTDSLTTINQFGVVGINATTGSGATNIGNSTAGGAIAIASNTAVGIDAKTASHFTVTGAADLTLRSTAGAVVISSAKAGANAIQLNCTDVAATISATMQAGSVVVSNTGKVTVTGDDLEVATAAKGVILGSGTKVIDGAGSPNASVTAPKGSLYLATNGSGVADRLYINTDGATAWTAITTVS